MHHCVEDLGLIGDDDGEENFFSFSQSGALGNETKTVEIHVCAGEDSAEGGLGGGGVMAGGVFLEPGEGESTGGLDNGTGVCCNQLA